jgi:hypothetical protein
MEIYQCNCSIKVLNDGMNIKFLGLEIDKCLNWKTHVKLMVPRLGKACFEVL